MRFPFISLLAILATLATTHGASICLSAAPTPNGILVQNVYYLWARLPSSNHMWRAVKLNRNIQDHQIEKALPLKIELCNQVVILYQRHDRLVIAFAGNHFVGFNVTVAAAHGGPCFGHLPQRNQQPMPVEGRWYFGNVWGVCDLPGVRGFLQAKPSKEPE